jgi:hypothetical protein
LSFLGSAEEQADEPENNQTASAENKPKSQIELLEKG